MASTLLGSVRGDHSDDSIYIYIYIYNILYIDRYMHMCVCVCVCVCVYIWYIQQRGAENQRHRGNINQSRSRQTQNVQCKRQKVQGWKVLRETAVGDKSEGVLRTCSLSSPCCLLLSRTTCCRYKLFLLGET